MVLFLILWIIQMFTGRFIFSILEIILVVILFYRILSRNVAKRQAENAKFVQLFRPLRRRFVSVKTRIQDRDHCYFKCPSCGQRMRVPRGKGKITIHCRNCGATFEKKT